MLTRRAFSTGLFSALAAPALLRAQQGPEARTLEELRLTALDLPQLHSILVQRGEEMILSEAPRGPGLGHWTNIKSCSKSIVALLTGAAIAQGAIPGIHATLGEVAPGLIPQDAAAGVADLTIEDLVTLRAGLEGTSHGNYGAWVASEDWVAYALSRPMIARPGEEMIYSTGTTHVLGAALTEATGDSLLDQARRVLGDPLDIEIPPWTRDPQGRYMGGNEMALTPEAMLRIAILMRDGGQWQGRQVIPADWIAASVQPHTWSDFSNLHYGYGWFLSESGLILARGYGGQIIAAHPARGLAIAITSDPTVAALSDGHFGQLIDLLEGLVALT